MRGDLRKQKISTRKNEEMRKNLRKQRISTNVNEEG